MLKYFTIEYPATKQYVEKFNIYFFYTKHTTLNVILVQDEKRGW